MAWRVMATARPAADPAGAAYRLLVDAGCELVTPPAWPMGREDLAEALQGCDAVISATEPYDAAMFAACPSLKLVSRCGVGYDSVDLDAASEAGVLVTNTPGAMSDAVADFTMGLILSLARHIPAMNAAMHEGAWRGRLGFLLRGKTLGLVGFGQIARGVARRAPAFGLRVLAYDPYVDAPAEGAELVPLADLLRNSDIVSLHVPMSAEARHIIDAASLALMKPTALLINTSRGGLIDEDALSSALSQGALGGAAIDVFEQEPLPADHPLRCAPNCILTPHHANNAVEAIEGMALHSARNVALLMHGDRSASVVNPSVWSSAALRLGPGR